MRRLKEPFLREIWSFHFSCTYLESFSSSCSRSSNWFWFDSTFVPPPHFVQVSTNLRTKGTDLLEALQCALHVLVTSEDVGEGALHRVQVGQGGLLLRCHSLQSLLGAQLVALLILCQRKGEEEVVEWLPTSFFNTPASPVPPTSSPPSSGPEWFVTSLLTNHLRDCLLIFCNNLPVIRQGKPMIRASDSWQTGGSQRQYLLCFPPADHTV